MQTPKEKSPTTSMTTATAPSTTGTSSLSRSTSSDCSSSDYSCSQALPRVRVGSRLKFVDDPFEQDPGLLSSEEGNGNEDVYEYDSGGVVLGHITVLSRRNATANNSDVCCEDDMLPVFPAEPSFDDVFSMPVRLASDDCQWRRRSALRLASLPIPSKSSLPPPVPVHPLMQYCVLSVNNPSSVSELPQPVQAFLAYCDNASVSASALRSAVLAVCDISVDVSYLGAVIDSVLKAAMTEVGKRAEDSDGCFALRAIQLLVSAVERDSRIATYLASERAIIMLLQVARGHARNALVQSHTLALLTPTLRQHGAVPFFVAHGGIEAVVWALETFRAIRPVVTHSASILRLSARAVSPDHRVRLGRVGALSVLTSALTRWSVAPRVQAMVIAAVTAIVRGSRTCQWIAGRAQVVEPVVAAMRTSPHELFFQMICADAVAALCDEELGNRIRVLDAEFLPHATLVLRLFAEDATIAVAFMIALASIVRNCPPVQAAFVSTGALEAVLRTAHLHAVNATVVAAASDALRYALESPTCRAALLSLDGVDGMVDALARGIARPDVVEPTLAAITAALSTADDFGNARRFVAIDGPCVVTDAMHRHIEHVSILWHGIQVLRSVTTLVPLPLPAIHAIVDIAAVTLMSQRYNPGMQVQGCALLVLLAKAGDALSRIEDAGIADLIDVTRTFHEEDDDVQHEVNALLTVLRVPPPSRRDIASISGSLLERIRSLSGSKRPDMS